MSEFPDYKKVSVEKLIPYARNSRTHSAEQVDQIAASIKEDAAVILANGIGNSESEVDFILTQLEIFGYLEV